MLQVLRSKDELHDFFFRRNLRKRVIHFAQGEIIICEGFTQNKAEVFLDGTVINVDRARRIAKPAILFWPYQVKEKCTQMGDICIIQRNVVCFLQPCASFKDRLQITVDRTWTVIDQFQDISNVLKFFTIKCGSGVLHVLSFRNRFTGSIVKLFRRRGTSTLEVNGKIKYTHLAFQVF